MAPENSLLSLHDSVTGLYQLPDASSSHPYNVFP